MKTTTFTGFQLVLFFVLIISSQGQGTSEQDSIIGKEIGPGIIFPMTPDEIEQEVNTSIFTAHDQITSLLSIPPEQRNETNTLIRFEEILTTLDRHLFKYHALKWLYPDRDRQNASMHAAQQRDLFMQDIAARDELAACITNVPPKSLYARWLYNETIQFFRLGGAGRPKKDKQRLVQLYQELDCLQNQYLLNIQEERPLSENLLLLNQIARTRNIIALILGYENWVEMKADEQGWKTNNSGILRQLYQNIPKIRKMTQPVVTDALLYKKTKDPHASMVYDYDITAYLRMSNQENTSYLTSSDYMPFNQTLFRALSIFSCLLNVKTELVPNAQTYAPGVLLFRVSDPATGMTQGWFYLDLNARPLKINEWMTTYIGTAELDDNGKKQPSTPVFIVSGLIKHDKPEKRFTTEDYSLLFHELGHVYTRIISSSQVSLSPPSPIPMELTEASSHLFEYLACTPEILGIITASDPSYAIQTVTHNPSKLCSDPFSNENLWNLAHDLVIGILDLQYAQSPQSISFGERYRTLLYESTGVSATDEGGYLLRHPHLAGTNAGNYWVYPMGRLYALAIYSRFKNDNVLNKTTWTDFSRNILIPEDQNMSAYERIMQFLNNDTCTRGNSWSYVPQCITQIIPIR